MADSSEDDETWSDIQAQADRIQGINNFVNETLNDAKEAASYDGVANQEAEEILGTEDGNIYGLYKEDNTDTSKNAFLTNSVTFDGVEILANEIGNLSLLRSLWFSWSKNDITDVGITNMGNAIKNLTLLSNLIAQFGKCEIFASGV